MKDIIIKKLKPQYTTVIVTMDTYEDNVVLDGVIAAKKGALKMYQRVISVGGSVRSVKEGDLVLLNLQNYITRKFEEDTLKEGMDKMKDVLVYDFPKIFIGGQLYAKLQERDIEGVIEDYEEVEIETASNENNLL